MTTWTTYTRRPPCPIRTQEPYVSPRPRVIDAANRSLKTPKSHSAHPKSQTRPSQPCLQAPQTPMAAVEFARSSHLRPDITRAPAAQRSPPPKRTSFLAGWRARRMTRSARNPRRQKPSDHQGCTTTDSHDDAWTTSHHVTHRRNKRER